MSRFFDSVYNISLGIPSIEPQGTPNPHVFRMFHNRFMDSIPVYVANQWHSSFFWRTCWHKKQVLISSRVSLRENSPVAKRHPVLQVYLYILVGGLEHEFYFPIYWVANHPNWLSYFSEGFKPPTSIYIYILLYHGAYCYDFVFPEVCQIYCGKPNATNHLQNHNFHGL